MSKTIFSGYDVKVYLEQFVEDNVFLYKLDNIEAISGGAYPGTEGIVGTIIAQQYAEDDVVASIGASIDETGKPVFEHETNLWMVQTAKNGISVVQGYKDLSLTGFTVGVSAADLGQSAVFQFQAERYFFPTNLKDFNESKLLLLKAAVTKLEDAIGDNGEIFCASQNVLDSVACGCEACAEDKTDKLEWRKCDEECADCTCEDSFEEAFDSEDDSEWFEINAETYEYVIDLMYHIIEDGGADFTRIVLFDTEDAVDGEEIEAFEEIYVYEENVDEVAEYVMDLLTTEAPDLKIAMILTNLD